MTRTGLPGGIAKSVDRFRIGLRDDVVQIGACLLLAVAGDDESVDGDLDGAALGRCLGAQVVDLGADGFDAAAIGEIPVGDARRHLTRRARAAALEYLGMGLLQRLGPQGVIGEAVKVAAEAEVVGRPDALQGANEFLGAAVALVVLQPMLPDRRELALELATDDIDGDAATGELIDGRQLLGRDRRVPRPGQDRGDHPQRLCRREQGVGEGDWLVLNSEP